MLQSEKSPIAEPQPCLKWNIIDIINVTVQPLLNSCPQRTGYWPFKRGWVLNSLGKNLKKGSCQDFDLRSPFWVAAYGRVDCILNSLLGVWKCGETWYFVFNINITSKIICRFQNRDLRLQCMIELITIIQYLQWFSRQKSQCRQDSHRYRALHLDQTPLMLTRDCCQWNEQFK